jgi:hypothetical protein
MARMIRRLRLMTAVGLVAAGAVLVPPQAAAASPKAAHAAAAPTAATVVEGTDCHYGAFGSGTVVHICASIHWTPQGVGGAALPAGAARHTKGPGPVTLYVTAVRLYDATTGHVIATTNRNNLGVDYVSEVGDGYSCEFPLPTHITFQAAFGIDAYLPGHTTPTHITQYSGKVTHSHCA